VVFRTSHEYHEDLNFGNTADMTTTQIKKNTTSNQLSHGKLEATILYAAYTRRGSLSADNTNNRTTPPPPPARQLNPFHISLAIQMDTKEALSHPQLCQQAYAFR
jgi:hypothetical protein